MINVEKGIEIPKKSGGPKPKYPFREMQVGDSFFCDCKHNPGSIARAWGDRHGAKFTVRAVDGGGWRVWRIE